ncbi:endonuclease Q family protein [Fervidibacillus halotolerans]|uniref:Endonuclease Q family protein n=1 Tax=Fervidibacillus halotolerans TaxID=2980027 RepID=A0A9E8M3P3_9BACI|nr:endonuclease Q family protein [Fervidibacillus halotolerans]WAA13824.1 endonuclease Q family protein [Fervidibacillus halotolerans]
MKQYFADFHIHIGRTKANRPVKITGAKNLTLTNILQTAKNQKGIDIVGVIDCHCPEVLEEIEDLIEKGKIVQDDGNLLFEGKTTLICGSELEIYDSNCNGPIHVLGYFPNLESMKVFSKWLNRKVKNIHLSSQRIYATGRELQRVVKALGGLFVPAHVFTPFKSLFGKGVEKDLTQVFDPDLIDAIELGLSSDTKMADHLYQLHRYPYLSNSDAHSLPKIGREYQSLHLEKGSFSEIARALKGKDGRKIVANYGLDPLLGKYYRSVCKHCETPLERDEGTCPKCESKQVIKGVSVRIHELTDTDHFPKRPPYIHQVPLEFIPGIGPKRLEKLLNRFGTEMGVIHHATFDQLKEVVPFEIASMIIEAREGNLTMEAGGGGRYGKLVDSKKMNKNI